MARSDNHDWDSIVPMESSSDEETPLLSGMDPNIGLSSKSLVGNRASKAPQFIAALAATLGGFVAGTVLGWTSPTQVPLTNSTSTLSNYPFTASASDFSLISALSAIGAMVGSLMTGPICDKIGRRTTMILSLIPVTVGWALMIWAQNVGMMQGGRFITGLVAGGMTVVAPLYNTEIAQIEIRGTLGTFFQLQCTLGILFVYILGACNVTVFWISLASAIIPFLFAGVMLIMPESPAYLLQKGNRAKAEKSLTWLRGSSYDPSNELDILETEIKEMKAREVSIFKAFTTKVAVRGLIIGLGIMFLQQFSGINAVVFFTTKIFESAGTSLKSSICTLIVGIVMFLFTIVSTAVVDRLGRKPLLFASELIMTISTGVLGLYFCIQNSVSNIGWLPLVAVNVFIIMFSVGFGPIPWMFMSEIFPPEIKGPACSIASMFNWVCVFFITYFFDSVQRAIGIDFTFWIFTIVSGLGCVFIVALVPETKGKSLEEIQRILGGEAAASPEDGGKRGRK